MRRGLITTFAIGAALSLAACGGDASDTASTAASAAGSAATKAATAASSAASSAAAPTASATASATATVGTDLLSSLATTPGVSLLPQAFGAAGLTTTLQGKGPLTVFAPSDAAFGTVPQATIQAAMADPQRKLKPILAYHIVPGALTYADLAAKNGQKLKTQSGATLTVKVTGGAVSLVDGAGNSVPVAKTEKKLSNGVLHTINRVLMPTK